MSPPDAQLFFWSKDALSARDAEAAVHCHRAVSYRDLRADIVDAAAGLRAEGFGKCEIVAIHRPHSYGCVAATLAVLMRGAVPLVVAPEWSNDLKRAVMHTFAPPKLCAEPTDPLHRRMSKAATAPARLAPLGIARERGDRPATLWVHVGSNERPRGGILGSAMGWAEMLRWRCERHPLGSGCVALQKASMGCHLALVELLWATCGRGTLKILPPKVATPGRSLWEHLADTGGTNLITTPAELAALPDAQPAGATSHLARLLCTGAPLPQALANRALDELGVALFNHWRAPECSPPTSYAEVKHTTARGGTCIGWPSPETQIRMLASSGRPSPAGQTGDLWVRGTGIGLGYFNDAQGSKQVSRRIGGPWRFRTDDRGVLERDGIRITGRADGGAATGGARLSDAQRTRRARPWKAPRSPRHSPQSGDQQVSAQTFEAPAAADTALGDRVAAIWWEVLGRSDVDDFVASGGQSLMAMRLAGRLRRELGVRITVGEVWALGSLSRLTARILGATGESTPPADQRPTVHAEALSQNEYRQWFLHQIGESGRFGSPIVLQSDLPFNSDAAIQAFHDVVARHPALRATYPLEGGEVRRKVAEPPLDLSGLVDCHGCTAFEEGTMDNLLADAVKRAFDITTELPVRLSLIPHGPSTWTVAFLVHTIATDGWSNGLIARDFARAYEARLAGGSSGLPPAPDYALYTQWQEALQGTPALTGHLDNAKRRAAQERWRPTGLPQVPGDCPGAVPILRLALRGAVALRRLCQRSGVTPYMALLTALSALLALWTGQPRTAITTPFSNRVEPEFDDMVGCLVNPVILGVHAAPETRFGALLSAVAACVKEALDTQVLPFNAVVEALRSDGRDGPHSNIVFVLQDDPQDGLQCSGFERRAADAMHVVGSDADGLVEAAEFALHIEAILAGEAIEIVYKFDPRRLGPTALRALHHGLEAIVAAVAEDVTRKIETLAPAVAPLLALSTVHEPIALAHR